jgi:flagellar motor component MotA
MQFIARIAAFAIVLFSCFIAGDLGAFIDVPSLLFVLPGTIFTMYAKYGKELFNPTTDEIKDKIGCEGISISFMWGYLGALVGFVIILGNLSDMAALGPALAVSLLTIFYSFLLALIVFYPLTKDIDVKKVFMQATFGFFLCAGSFGFTMLTVVQKLKS